MDILAANASDELDTDSESKIQSIKRWQQVFHYTHAEATARIRDHRANLSRAKVSGEHWEIVRSQKEAAGYDREAYEYSMNLVKARKHSATGSSDIRKPSTYLLKLEELLATAIDVQKAAGLKSAPAIISGVAEAGDEAKFCYVDGAARKAILESLTHTAFQPSFVWMSRAEKSLSNTSIYPTLSVDSTLPQYRQSNLNTILTFSPAQDQYPI